MIIGVVIVTAIIRIRPVLPMTITAIVTVISPTPIFMVFMLRLAASAADKRNEPNTDHKNDCFHNNLDSVA